MNTLRNRYIFVLKKKSTLSYDISIYIRCLTHKHTHKQMISTQTCPHTKLRNGNIYRKIQIRPITNTKHHIYTSHTTDNIASQYLYEDLIAELPMDIFLLLNS